MGWFNHQLENIYSSSQNHGFSGSNEGLFRLQKVSTFFPLMQVLGQPDPTFPNERPYEGLIKNYNIGFPSFLALLNSPYFLVFPRKFPSGVHCWGVVG